MNKPAVTTVLAGLGMAAFLASRATPAAQVRPYVPPQQQKGSDWTERIGELLPPGVETRAEATERIATYTPDPVKFPVKRTTWDGKPDFAGVYWPEATVTSPSVPQYEVLDHAVRLIESDKVMLMRPSLELV